MKTTSIDRLIEVRLSQAGLRIKASYRSKLAQALVERLTIGHVLAKMSNIEIYQICQPDAEKEGGSK